MLLRNLYTGEIFEAISFEPIEGGGSGGVTIEQVRAEITKNVGKGIQLGFDGTLSGETITFEPPSSTGTYTIKENYDYEIDLSFLATSSDTMDDDIAMVIKNGDDTIYFWTVKDSPATWGDLKDIYTYSTSTGYRWLFKARFHITSEGNKVFYIFPAVDNSLTSVQLYSDGNAIYDKQGGTALTFNQVYSLISNKFNLVNINFGDMVIMYPAFFDDDAICFSNTYIVDNYGWFQRIIINKDNDVLYNEYKSVKPTDYATTTTGGVVKVDDNTITIDDDGVISANVAYNDEGELVTINNNWIWVNRDIAQGRELTTNNRKLYIDISEYLPEDSNKYELMFSCLAYNNGTWLENIQLYVTSDVADENETDNGTFICANTKIWNNVDVKEYCGGQCIFPVGADRTVYIENKGTTTATIEAFKIVGYKRV